MATIRRLYLYAVLFVSLLAFIWGMIGALNALLPGGLEAEDSLASSLSIALVAAPIFGLHWWLALRSARRDAEEAQARSRAVFLYAGLLATLIPSLQNGMLIVERFLRLLFGLPTFRTFLFGEDTWGGGLIAITINLLAAGYFFLVLRDAWQELPANADEFNETRRLYRYLWLFYSLILFVLGAQQILFFLLSLTSGYSRAALNEVAAGIALLSGGIPLWFYWDRRIRASLNHLRERFSVLRLSALYFLVFSGAIFLLAWAVSVLREIIAPLLDGNFNLATFFSRDDFATSLSWLIAFVPFWVHYRRILKNTIIIQGNPPVERSATDSTLPTRRTSYLPRQAALLRIYTYFMASLGLIAGSFGLSYLLAALIALLVSPSTASLSLLTPQGYKPVGSWLASGLPLFMIGVPLWWYFWRPQTREAALDGEAGDHTRRSLVRKIYLYLILFASVIGSMLSAGRILFLIIQSILGEQTAEPVAETLDALRLLLIFAGLGAYHGLWLRSDLRLAGNVLARRHAQYPVLVLTPEPPPTPSGVEPAAVPSSPNTIFGEAVVNALQRRAPSLPVAVHLSELGAPDETLSAARAVILPSGLLAKAPEGLRVWLQGFNGARVVIPTPASDWYWTGRNTRSLNALARQAANMIGRLAEGEDVSSEGGAPAWQNLAYVFAVLFVLQIVLIAVMSLADMLLN